MQTVFGQPTASRFDDEFALLADEARLTRGVLFSSNTEMDIESQDEKVKAMLAEGLNVASVTVPRSGGGVGGLFTGNLWFQSRSWQELLALNNVDRLKAIRDAQTRQRLAEEIKAQNGGEFPFAKRWFPMGDDARPRYSQALNESVYDIAQAAGEHPVETWLRITDQSDGKALFHMRLFNMDIDDVACIAPVPRPGSDRTRTRRSAFSTGVSSPARKSRGRSAG